VVILWMLLGSSNVFAGTTYAGDIKMETEVKGPVVAYGDKAYANVGGIDAKDSDFGEPITVVEGNRNLWKQLENILQLFRNDYPSVVDVHIKGMRFTTTNELGVNYTIHSTLPISSWDDLEKLVAQFRLDYPDVKNMYIREIAMGSKGYFSKGLHTEAEVHVGEIRSMNTEFGGAIRNGKAR